MTHCICPDDGEWCPDLRRVNPGAFAPDDAPEPYYCEWEQEGVDVTQEAPAWCRRRTR